MANNLKTVALLGLLGGIFVAVGWLFGGSQGALLALGFAVLFNFGIYWFSDRDGDLRGQGPARRRA